MSHESTDPDERTADDEAADSDEQAESLSNTDDTVDPEILEAIAEDESLSDPPATESRQPETGAEASAVRSPIPIDTLFELLATPGNRFVLTYLLRENNPATYSDLVEYVATRAREPEDLTDAKFRGQIAARLVNWNLPRLEEAGLVEHDSDEHLVTATPAIETVAPYLALAISQSGSPGE